jgi:hypothetical protein
MRGTCQEAISHIPIIRLLGPIRFRQSEGLFAKLSRTSPISVLLDLRVSRPGTPSERSHPRGGRCATLIKIEAPLYVVPMDMLPYRQTEILATGDQRLEGCAPIGTRKNRQSQKQQPNCFRGDTGDQARKRTFVRVFGKYEK